MNPEELKKQLEDVEKKKKRTALLLSLGFAVLAVIVIFSIYTAFVKNTSKERSETTKYSLFERIFGAGNTPTTTNTSQQQSTDSTKQITGSKSALGTTFTSLTQKWLEGYKKNVNIQSTNIVRPLAVSMAIFDDPAYVKKYGKINKESATLEDISQAIEFSRTKKVEIKDQLDVLQNQFDGYTGDLAAETKSLEQLKKQLSDLEKSDGASVAQKILTTEERIKIQSQIDAINKNIATLEAYIKSHPNDPTSILDAKKAQIVSLKNELLLLQSKLNSTPNSNFTKNAQIQSLQKQIQALEKEINP